MTGLADPRACPYVGLDPFEKAYEPFFFGREQDSRVIADHVVSRAITVLYGPSGVGKSSVLNVGLPAALRRRAPWTVVTLRDWQDPNAIEQRAIEALQAALPTGKQNSHSRSRFARQVVGVLRTTKQPLVLILDQFEEYFLYRTENLLEVEKALGALLTRRDLDVHVIIGLRDDSLHLLDKARAIFPGILDTTVRLGHLNDAAAKEAILGPIRQYNKIYRQDTSSIEVQDDLIKTLIGDLRQASDRPVGDTSGPQLPEPIELPYLQLTMTKLWAAEGGRDSTVLRAETLTRKLGGVQQIAREHVDRILGGLTRKEQALCADIFRNLVTSSGSKIAYPTNDLARQINEDRRQAGDGRTNEIVGIDEVAAVLRRLTPTETRLLKPVKANGVDAFELFHDVLGQPVLRWRQEFRANARLHAEQRRGRLLLGLATTFGLITLLAVLATGYAYVQTVQARETLGRSVWSSLVLESSGLEPSDIDALWRVTGFNEHERDGFLAPITGKYFHRGPVARFAAWIAASLHLTGPQLLDDARPDKGVVQRMANRQQTVLRALGLRPLTEAQAQAAISLIIEAANKRTTDLPAAIGAFDIGGRLTNLSMAPTQEDARSDMDGYFQIFGEMVIQSERYLALAKALQAMPAELTPAQAQAATDPIIATMKQTTDPFVLWALAWELNALAAKLADTNAEAAIESILAAAKRTTNPFDIWAIEQALAALPVKFTNEQVQAASEPVLVAIKRTTDPLQLQALAKALQAIAGKFTDEQAQSALDTLSTAMIQQVTYPYALRSLALALKSLPAKFNESTSRNNIEVILTAMQRTVRPDELKALASALPAKLSGAQTHDATDAILTAMNRTTNPSSFQTLAEALQPLDFNFSDAEAKAAIEPMLAAMQSDNLSTLEAVTKGLKTLTGKLTDAQAQAVIGPTLAAIKETNSDSLLSRALTLQAFAAKLSDAQADAAIDPMLAIITRSSFLPLVRTLADGLQPLADKVTDAKAREVTDTVLSAIKRWSDDDLTLGPLVGSLGAFAARVDEVQARELLSQSRLYLATAKGNKAAEAWAGAIAKLMTRERDDRAFLSGIVEAIKYPTTAGPPTDVLMTSLRQRFPGVREFQGNLDAAIPWFEKELGSYAVERPAVLPK